MNIEKKQTSDTKGFTLVELIVVITILAILASIAFLSFSGYSASARDSKRTSDLTSINTKISIMNANGTSLMSFISGTGSRLTGITLAGTGSAGIGTGSEYEAGDVNYTTLGVKNTDFQDPTNVNYKIGATTLVGGAYQIAAKLETTAIAQVVGNYNNRAATTVVGTGGAAANTINIPVTDVGKFKKGDYISGTGTGTITGISADGVRLTVSFATTQNTVYTGTLAVESTGLIGGVGSLSGTAVTNNGIVVPY